MILVTGASGFIGAHVIRAIHDLGEQPLALARGTRALPAQLADLPVVTEQADISDLDSLREVGQRHHITGIVHLAGYAEWLPAAGEPIASTRRALDGLLNVIEVATAWGVKRVGVASTIAVYGGVAAEGGLSEDIPLPMTSMQPVPRSKKITEMLNEHLAETVGVDVVNFRISATWGPGSQFDPFSPASALARAAVTGTDPDLSDLEVPAHADDAYDLTYVKDIGRAIALLQTAENLEAATYNVGSGRATSNRDVMAAIKAVIPDARLELPAGAQMPSTHLDISRLQRDTGYQPEFDPERAARDYIDWLRAGHDR